MSVVSTLRQADIFYGFTLTQLELIASISTEHSYAQWEIVFEENTTGSELYVIAQGEIDIQVRPAAKGKRAPASPQTIARLRRGQSFGEIAAIDQGVRSARALVTQPETRLVVIPRDRLMLMCDAYPHMGYRLMRNLAADLAMKLRNADLKIRECLAVTHADDA